VQVNTRISLAGCSPSAARTFQVEVIGRPRASFLQPFLARSTLYRGGKKYFFVMAGREKTTQRKWKGMIRIARICLQDGQFPNANGKIQALFACSFQRQNSAFFVQCDQGEPKYTIMKSTPPQLLRKNSLGPLRR
jgi:hypothetical protein